MKLITTVIALNTRFAVTCWAGLIFFPADLSGSGRKLPHLRQYVSGVWSGLPHFGQNIVPSVTNTPSLYQSSTYFPAFQFPDDHLKLPAHVPGGGRIFLCTSDQIRNCVAHRTI